MKPVVGELVFCSGRYCYIVFGCNVGFGALTVLLNASVMAALLRIARRNTWKISNVIICGMVITDLCTGLICQPLHGYFVYRQKNIFNPEELEFWEAWLFFALNYSSYVLCCSSLLITALMAIERLMAVVYTMKHRSISNVTRTTKSLVVAAIISAIIPIFRFVSSYTRIVFMALLVLVVAVALTTVAVSYFVLYRSFKKQRIAAEMLSTAEKDKLRGLKQERRLAKTFAIINIVLFLMYLPQMLLKPVSIVTEMKRGSALSEFFVVLEDSFNTFLYTNAAVNPFIYFIRQKELRQEILSVIPCWHVAKNSKMTQNSTSEIKSSTSL